MSFSRSRFFRAQNLAKVLKEKSEGPIFKIPKIETESIDEKDPASPMKHLPYKAIDMYVNIKGCMEPNPAVRGYFLIEVWDRQVNIGLWRGRFSAQGPGHPDAGTGTGGPALRSRT